MFAPKLSDKNTTRKSELHPSSVAKQSERNPWRPVRVDDGVDSMPAASWDFGSIALNPPLAIGHVDDPSEREADQAAEQAMQTGERGLAIFGSQRPPSREFGSSKNTGRADPRGTSAAFVNGSPDIASALSRSPGRELEPSLRGVMESRLHHDFSRVRVHDDALGASAARAANARAFTFGSHITFAQAPDMTAASGRQLLAHELAHVVQQSAPDGTSHSFLLQREPESGTGPQPNQLPQVVIDLLQQTDGGRWSIKVFQKYSVPLILTKTGRPAYYDANNNSCTVNIGLAPAVVASYFVHEMYHVEREKSGKGGDPKKMEKDPFIKKMVNEEIQGTIRGYQAYLELEQKGQVPANTPLPPRYDSYKRSYNGGREEARKSSPAATEAELHAAGLKNAAESIRWYVLEGGLGPFEGVTYGQFYASEWNKAQRR